MKKSLLIAVALIISAVTGIKAQSLYFDGNNDNVSIPNSKSLKISKAFTFEAWINVQNYQYSTIAAKWDDDSNHRAWMINMGALGDNTQVCVLLADTDGANNIQFSTGYSLALNTWYNIAVTFDATRPDSNINYYVNGKLIASGTYTHVLTPNKMNMILGGYDGAGNGVNAGADSAFFDGIMDNVRLDTVALDSAQVAMDANCSYTTTGLVAAYNFNEGIPNDTNYADTILIDNSGNGNNGKLMNFALNGTYSNWVGDLFNPIISLNSLFPYNVTASSSYGGNPPQNAFDGDTVYNGWGNNNILPAWLQIDFGAGNNKVINSYSIYCSSQMYGGWGSATYDPAHWTFQGFDGTKWDTLDIRRDTAPQQDIWKSYSFTNTTAYQMYRIYIDSTGDGGYAMITEMKLSPDPTICGPKLFSASVTGGPGVKSFQWMLNKTNVGTNNDSVSLASYHNGDTVKCVIQLNDSGGCFTPQMGYAVLSTGGHSVTTTTAVGPTITADQTGVTYQWIDCGTGLPIVGATSQSYTAIVNGNYKVVLTNSCYSDTSTCVYIGTVGVNNLTIQNGLNVYPNPSNGVCTIKANSEGIYAIKDELGQTIQVIKLDAANGFTAQTANLNNGIYFVTCIDNNKENIVRKIVVIK